jgi:hypothetical protein
VDLGPGRGPFELEGDPEQVDHGADESVQGPAEVDAGPQQTEGDHHGRGEPYSPKFRWRLHGSLGSAQARGTGT